MWGYHSMNRFIIWMLLILGIWACNPDKRKRIDAEHIVYKSNDATKLFFRNMRAIYYDKQTLEQAKIDVYRMKDRNQTEDYPVLNLALVNNWLQDEAYIIIEPNGFFSVGDTIRVTWQEESGRQGESIFIFGNKDNHTRFADEIYNNILSSFPMRIHKDEEEWPLFNSPNDKETFRKTMVDFYRLVQRL